MKRYSQVVTEHDGTAMHEKQNGPYVLHADAMEEAALERQHMILLFRLHALIACGGGDDSDADAVRDEMDGTFNKLPGEARARIEALSAAMYQDVGIKRIAAQRDAVVEECAKVVENQDEWCGHVKAAAAAIRALKGKPPQP